MKIAVAMLADFALAHRDGKLYVTGGGIRSLAFPAFPATHPRLSLAVGLDLSTDDFAKPHTIRITPSAPELSVKPGEISFDVSRAPDKAGQRGYSHFVYNMENLSFAAEGDYSFAIAVDGGVLAEVPLSIGKSRGPVPPALQVQMLLTQGFKAYTAGDLAAAEKIFREITERFPDSADGQNNLGFVLLSKGDAEAGKRAFLRARELGYSRLEVSDANIAAADYVLGDFSAAGALFQGCLKQYSAPGGSTLLGLGPRGLFPVSVSSASGYVALMNLNSAWCALHLGDSAAAVRHLEVAKALEQELGAGAMSEELARSMSVLESELRGPR